MLKCPLVGAVLVASAMLNPVHAQQPLLAALDDATTARLSVQVRCTQAPVDVIAASANERHLACDAANKALQLLARCNIYPREALRIEMAREVRRPFGGAVFGLFDPKEGKIHVTQHEAVEFLVSGTPYSVLPRREFYESLIVHEVIHGVMHQNYKRPPASHAAYEYPAYALQIESLPAGVRDKFLQTINIGTDKSEIAFNDAILSFNPFFFAARAYEHFRDSANACAHLHALIEGEVAFIWTLPSSL